MAWKIEKWMEQLLTGEEAMRVWGEYDKLGLREAAIVVCAELDMALAELISKRLTGNENEIVDFLGADEDGRAPAGSFGSRIQLAYLLGLMSQNDLQLLRRCKDFRNHMAHRVMVKYSDEKVKRLFVQIRDGFWNKLQEDLGDDVPPDQKSTFAGLKDANTFKRILASVLTYYRLHFYILTNSMPKLQHVEIPYWGLGIPKYTAPKEES